MPDLMDNIGTEREAYKNFLHDYSAYAGTAILDDLRASDYRRLDDQQHTYLDYTGAGLYGSSQVQQHAELLNQRILGNPHSAGLSSSAATSLVESTRQRVLDYFGVPGGAGAHLLVGRVGDAAAGVPGLDPGDAFDLLEHRFEAPEATARQGGLLGLLRAGGGRVVHLHLPVDRWWTTLAAPSPCGMNRAARPVDVLGGGGARSD